MGLKVGYFGHCAESYGTMKLRTCWTFEQALNFFGLLAALLATFQPCSVTDSHIVTLSLFHRAHQVNPRALLSLLVRKYHRGDSLSTGSAQV